VCYHIVINAQSLIAVRHIICNYYNNSSSIPAGRYYETQTVTDLYIDNYRLQQHRLTVDVLLT